MSNKLRIVRLEACRGIAAMVVIAQHTLEAFAPAVKTLIWNSPARISVNGAAAVVFFFVLSGYVLTARFFAEPSLGSMALAALKRLPRLALLTTSTTIASSLLWYSNLYRFEEASRISGSEWLASFGGGDTNEVTLGVIGAIREGVWATFLVGDSRYDSSLWTMVYEFHGSLLVFAFAHFIVFVLRRRMVWLAVLLAAIVLQFAKAQFMLFFLAGMSIAYYETWLRKIDSLWLKLALFGAAIALLSRNIQPDQGASTLMVLCWLAGASCLVIAVLCCSPAERLLNNSCGRLIGFISFPLYVIHVPIICSAGSLALVATNGSPVSAAICTVLLTFLVALPLAYLDRAWVRTLNQVSTIASKIARHHAQGVRRQRVPDARYPASPH
jgi:peptidoglycan/LPS O-acetylase OafA/YrhL